MSTAYKVFDRLSNYDGGYGSAKKDNLMDIHADRIDQQIFPFDLTHMDSVKEGASGLITDAGLKSRLQRDLAFDAYNPREELPKAEGDIKMIDLIPNLIAQMPDMSHPADFEANNNVRLLQESRVHQMEQETMFTDPKALENKNLYMDLPGKVGTSGVNQAQVFGMEGSAAGYNSNRLVDVDGAYLNSIESVHAF